VKTKILISIVVVGVAATVWQVRPVAETVQRTPAALPIRVAEVSKEPLVESRVFTGTTRPVNRAVVRSQIAGRVAKLPAFLGQQVKQGDLLLELYNPEAAPAVLIAERQWRQAQSQQGQRQRDYDRLQALVKKGTASKQEHEQARTALETANDAMLGAESEYHRAQQLDAERLIRAPFDGVVTAIDTDIGEVVSPGQHLIRVADPGQVELELVVSQDIADSLQIADAVNVTLPLSGDAQRKAVVAEISPFRERRALPTIVLRFPSGDVRPGIAASAHFHYEQGEAYQVPVGALVSNGDGAILYRVDNDNKAWQVPVKVLDMQNQLVAIHGDLNSGDRVVVAGSHRLHNGALVSSQPDPKSDNQPEQ